MTICFDNIKDATRERIEDVEYVEVDFSVVHGRPTRFWKVYLKDGTIRTLKYKDYMFYWCVED